MGNLKGIGIVSKERQQEMKGVFVLLVVSIFVVGCSSIDWSGFYAYTDTLHHDDGSPARVLRENLDKGYMTEEQVECWTQDNYGWDNGCATPTPIAPVSPVKPDGVNVEEWLDSMTDQYNNYLEGK